MALELNWVGFDAKDRIALTRMRCYSPAAGRLPRFDDSVTQDGRQRAGDFLLATRDGVDVGTATSLSLHMWMRGARVTCQGVAYVGTIKTHRRGGSADGERGIASAVMHETLRLAREREQIVSALMPFRASFYEHFGYGNAEQRVEWTVPLTILPRGDFNGYRFYEKADDAKLVELRAREAPQGQCDVETDAAALASFQRSWDDGMVFVDQPTPDGPIAAWVRVLEERTTAATAIVDDWAAESPAAFKRILHFLASLKDQYSVTKITVPGGLAMNRLMRETQIPHRQVDHPVSVSRPYTRMQIRVLDHKKLLEAMHFPAAARGKVSVAIRECEGTTTKLALDLDGGRCVVGTGGEPDVEMNDVLWASIISGDLRASAARELGLIKAPSQSAIDLLDVFAVGQVPFCQEYF